MSIRRAPAPVFGGSIGGYSPRATYGSPVTYAAPQQQVTYAAPQQQVTYAAAPQQVTYAAPQQQFTYAAPQPQVTYIEAPQQVTYAAPQQQFTYAAPPQQVSYAAPAQSFLVSQPMIERDVIKDGKVVERDYERAVEVDKVRADGRIERDFIPEGPVTVVKEKKPIKKSQKKKKGCC